VTTFVGAVRSGVGKKQLRNQGRRGFLGGRSAKAWLGLAGILTLAAVMELLPRVGVVEQRFLPPLSQLLGALMEAVSSLDFWLALSSTLRGWAIGLTVAMLSGVLIGAIIGSIPLLRAVTASTIEFLRPIPSVALIPLAVLLWGTDMLSTLVLVIYAAFWPILLQVLSGIEDVDPVARETARSYRFSTFTELRTVVWPSALPFVMTGLRLSAAVALILEITGELVIGSPGLGNVIAIAQRAGNVDTMYALVLVTGLIGVAVNTGVRSVERRLLRWHPSIRREVP
jgi:ABC-type nitrate/sulfonate/bicarbonate transport system permease component